MRFIMFEDDDARGVATLAEGGYRGLTEKDARFPGSLDTLIAGGGAWAKTLHELLLDKGAPIDVGQIRYLPPFATPGKIICVGLNYLDHTAESGYEQPDYPTLFPRFPSSLIGHEAPMIRPRVSDTLDFEGELAVIVGRKGRHVAKGDALGLVAGYALFNEGSVREYQFKSPQWTVGKNFDDTGAFGPEFVTVDELPEGARGLRIETRLNGKTMQSANTDQLVFDIPTLISVISEAISLAPGDVIVTGTPSGIGHARDPRVYMKDGDVCEVEIEGLGILRNPIRDESSDGAVNAASPG